MKKERNHFKRRKHCNDIKKRRDNRNAMERNHFCTDKKEKERDRRSDKVEGDRC